MIAEKQHKDISFADCYNVGPDENDCFQTGKLVELFVEKWGNGLQWVNQYDDGPHEANFLKLDCSKLKSTFNWKPHWTLDIAIDKVIEWNKCWINGQDINKCMDEQIKDFLGGI